MNCGPFIFNFSKHFFHYLIGLSDLQAETICQSLDYLWPSGKFKIGNHKFHVIFSLFTSRFLLKLFFYFCVFFLKEIICNFRSSTTGGSAQENKPLTEVTSENRNVFVDVINSLKVGGGTCLGLGLMKGMDVRGEPLIKYD